MKAGNVEKLVVFVSIGLLLADLIAAGVIASVGVGETALGGVEGAAAGLIAAL